MDKRIIDLPKMQKTKEQESGADDRRSEYLNDISCGKNDFCTPPPANDTDGVLTMAFVNMQPLEDLYPPETAFINGTLFPDINKPFYGGNRR